MAASTKRKQSSSNTSVTQTATDSFSYPSRVLWQFIGGVGALQPKQVVEVELKKNHNRLILGLDNFTPQSTPSGERLRTEKNVSELQCKFVQGLAHFLGIDEVQCYEVYCNFLTHEYRSSKKTLQSDLANARQTPALMVQVRDFYFSERLYLLRCLKHVLSYWSQNSQHHHRMTYASFVEEAAKDDKLIKSLCEQYDKVCTQPLPTWETHGTLMNNKQSYLWAKQNLREQCHLLELTLLYYKDYQATPKMFMEFLEKFKRQGFGRHQVYKHILDGTCDDLIDRISYLQLLIILQCIDLELLNQSDAEKTDENPILQEDHFKKFDRLFTTLGASNIQGTLLLSWATVRHIYYHGSSDIVTRKLGHQALQLDCFRVLVTLLKSEPFCGKSVMAAVSHYLVYVLLYSVIRIFHEDTLGDTTALYEAVELVFTQEFVASHVWQSGLTDGLGTLLHAALEKFPLEFSPFVRLCATLSSASQSSAQKVVSLIRKMPVYTELFDANNSHNIRSTNDSTIWVLAKDKYPYPQDEFVIPGGCKGQLFPRDKGGSVIHWVCNYNGWQLLHAEIQLLLSLSSRGSGAVPSTTIERVVDTCRLISNILTSDVSFIDSFIEISPVFYKLIHKFSSSSQPPLTLLALCLQATNKIACIKPIQVWQDMRQTGLLPFMSENLDNMTEVLNGSGLHAGQYGSILMGHECSTAHYPVTTAFLSLLSTLVKPLVKMDHMTELLPCILYILREVFPAFSKWRYTEPAQRELIGEKCLELFHKIVDIRPRSKPQSGPDLRDICVQSLLFSESGQALLDIVATGEDVIETTQSQQASCDEGYGVNLINLVRLSFSILNRLLLLKPASLPVSPVEHALSSQPASQSHEHIVATIARYIYHRYNPSLPNIAIALLTRLAVVRPMAILACLGHDAETLRDAFLMRLRASSEDVNLKVVILEFLSVSVETQPGLIEMFLNVRPRHGDDKSLTKTDVTVGKDSCLHTLLDLMSHQKQGSYLCPPVLLRACTSLIQSLWFGMRESAMSALRSQKTFWPSVMAAIMRDLPSHDIQAIGNDLRTCAHVFCILAQEFFLLSGKVYENFKTVLAPIKAHQRLQYWSTFIRDLLASLVGVIAIDGEDSHPGVVILDGWKNLLVTLAVHEVADINITDATKCHFLDDLLHTCGSQFTGEMTELNMRLASLSSAVYFTLLKSWSRSLKDVGRVLGDVEKVLIQTCTTSKTLIPSVQIGLLGSLTLILDTITSDSLKELPRGQLNALLCALCPLVLHSTYQLTPPTPGYTPHTANPLNSQLVTVDWQEGQELGETNVKLKLHVMSLCVLRRLLELIAEPSDWLPILQQHSIVPSLLVSLSGWIKVTQGKQYVHAACMLLQTMAWTHEGAACVSSSGVTENTCLILTNIYNSRHVVHNLSRPITTLKPPSDSVTWHQVYCQWLDIYSTLLDSLRYSFVKDALDIVGVHQDRLQQSLDITRLVLHEDTLMEAKASCRLLCELSNFIKEWRFQLPEVLNKLLTSMLLMCQTFVSFLIRPRYLLHLIERQAGTDHGAKGQAETPPLPSVLQSQTSTDDVDISSTRLAKIQQQMMEVLAICVSTLRSFTPNLCALLLDQSLDVSEYESFLQIGFGRPSLDQDLDPPTYGTFLDCITVCVRLLTKVEGRTASPSKSADPSNSHLPPKNLIQFVLENSLYIVLTQACRHLTEPSIHPRDKQLLKRELGAELNSFFMSYQRYMKRGGPPSPGGSTTSPRTPNRQERALNRHLSFSTAQDPPFFKLVHEFMHNVLR